MDSVNDSNKAYDSKKEKSFSVSGTAKVLLRPAERNIIAGGTRLIGNIDSNAEIYVEGEVQGDIITSKDVFIGRTGVVKGKVVCNAYTLWGEHHGTAIARSKSQMGPQANKSGEMETPKLIIESGARYTGELKLVGEVEAQKKKR
ncbi:MAG: polymer-forming cytoskeletal protein [Marinifilaceae bacterium]